MDEIKRRIELKEQLIYLTLQEIAELENKLNPAWQSPREDCLRRITERILRLG